MSNVWRISRDGGPAEPVTNFKTDRIFSFAWSHDGKQLALARGSLTSDAVLFTSAR